MTSPMVNARVEARALKLHGRPSDMACSLLQAWSAQSGCFDAFNKV
ncbi:MAG: hypothetical protein ABWU16_09045 [Halothiobacillaceae bacterium]